MGHAGRFCPTEIDDSAKKAGGGELAKGQKRKKVPSSSPPLLAIKPPDDAYEAAKAEMRQKMLSELRAEMNPAKAHPPAAPPPRKAGGWKKVEKGSSSSAAAAWLEKPVEKLTFVTKPMPEGMLYSMPDGRKNRCVVCDATPAGKVCRNMSRKSDYKGSANWQTCGADRCHSLAQDTVDLKHITDNLASEEYEIRENVGLLLKHCHTSNAGYSLLLAVQSMKDTCKEILTAVEPNWQIRERNGHRGALNRLPVKGVLTADMTHPSTWPAPEDALR
jgi:hypothetical protein